MFKAAGAKRLISVDLHSGQIQGFFDGPVDHLTAMPVLVDYMSGLGEDLVVVSPDAGRVKVAERYANQLHADLAIVHKRRVKGVKNTVEARDVVGEVDGRVCVLIDDMIDTGGTIVKAAETLFENGAKDVIVAATHGILSDPARERLQESRISEVIVTNTLPIPEDRQFEKLTILSIAPILAKAITEVFTDGSVTSMFEDESNEAEASSH
jgi:ribose-phosphate pyrophosphokinase